MQYALKETLLSKSSRYEYVNLPTVQACLVAIAMSAAGNYSTVSVFKSKAENILCMSALDALYVSDIDFSFNRSYAAFWFT